MSETDDTDDLILIPPDLFVTEDLEEPYLSGPYYNVVDTLISQVNHLEDRLNRIESGSNQNRSNSLDCQGDSSGKIDLMSIRKYSSSDDIDRVNRDRGFESTQSTPQKPQSYKFVNPDRFNSPRRNPVVRSLDGNIEKLQNYEEKNAGTKQILQEIDQYISDLQSSEEKKAKNSLNLRDLDRMLRKVEEQKQEFGKKKKESNPIVKNGSRLPSTSDVSLCSNEKSESVSGSSEPTQRTALLNVDRLPAGGDYYCGQVVCDVNGAEFSEQNLRTNQAYARQEKLLSLSDLWRGGNDRCCVSKEEQIVRKLEEERLRRQHCEQLIHQLQSRTLELQERLAVAVQVDEAKDDAILKFHTAWEKIADRLQILTKERNELEEEIASMQAQYAENVLESTKKINHFENEASKALSLAQSSQDRVRGLEADVVNMTGEIQSLNATVETLQNQNRMELEKNKDLSEQLDRRNLQLNEMNVSVEMLKNEVSNSKKAIDFCQHELISIRTQNAHLEMTLNEKNDMIQSMERHNKKLMTDIDTHKKIEKDLQQELNRTKESGDKTKTDLRNFYQDQVEMVVRDKLKEFQTQLDKAESVMQEELKKRELTIAKSAAKHIQQIADKHSLEIKLVEEKHAEEVRLYQVKLSQIHQHVESLQSKLNLQQQKKTDMVKQLHRVMEAQWLEALKIINNGKSPCVPNGDRDVTLNQLNVLKTKSYTNLEEMLFTEAQAEEQHEKEGGGIPPLNLAGSSSSMQDDSNSGYYAYCLNAETPLTSRPKTKQQIENELQKYVQLLLNKQPSQHCEGPCAKRNENYAQDLPTWQGVCQDEKEMPRAKDRKSKKPWR